MHRLIGLLLVASLAACGAGGSSSTPSPPDNQVTTSQPQTLLVPAAGSLYHGVLPAGTTSDISPESLDAYERAVGRDVAWVYSDDEWIRSRAFPLQTVSWIRDRGAVPFVRLMMRSQKVPLVTDPTFTLERILAGEFDGDLAAWAEGARNFGTPLVVEYGTEVNGWALHYNSENFPGTDPRNRPVPYYPGDDLVDWVGISAYGSERSNDQRCPTFASLVDALLGGRWPDVRGFSWWQQRWSDDRGNGSLADMIVQDDPGVSSAFRAALTGPAAAKVIDRPLLK